MADEQIVTNIVATSDFSSLIADVQRTTSALTKLQQELALSNKTLSAQAGQIQKAFGETLRSTGQFTTHFVTVGSEIDRFGKNLDAGKLKLRDYFGTWQQHTKTSGGLIRDLAKQQVALQNAIVQPLGKSADGLMKFNVHVANGIDTTLNKTALARKEMQIYNKVIQDGGVQLINWGKNTQWAGRQLTVGLTVPIAAFGAAAQKAFREADQELVRLTKVYGGLSATSSTELAKVRKDVSDTARELAKSYGSSYKDTIALAADIAATGKQGNELLESTKEATRLSILGEVDRQEAMKATLAIQSAFKQNTDELTESINFLNAVENQTSTSLADLVEAIPKAGPVVKALGGDVQDLALYLTAMREGGINASEGANALKSALASIINPTKVAKEQFMGFGIDLSGIVNKNAGNLTATILGIQAALETLDPLKKSQAIEQLFGKFQFARMNALFENLGKQGSQTLQVLDLMKSSSQDLANVAGRELSQITESASGQYRRAIESLKADLAGLGEQFLRISTFFIKTVDGLVKFINNLPGPLKTVITLLTGFTALAGPLIMLTGVFANFIGYVIKGIGHIRALGRGGEGFKLLTPQILAAEQAGSLIEKTFYSDAQAAGVLQTALSNLTNELTILQQKAASGSISVQPTLSTIQGNMVLEGTQRVADPSSPYIGKPYTRQMLHQNPVAGMTTEEKAAQTIFGVTPGPGPVNQRIGKNPQIYMTGDMERIKGLTEISGVSTGIVAEEAAKWHSMTAALAMQSKEEIALLKREVAATGTVTTELSTSYQALLPKMTEITVGAAEEAKLIVAQLNASKITVDQARAQVIQLNARIEAMMAETTAQIAQGQGRVANITTVPLTGQPVVDPVTGKSNMKEMFHKSKTSALVDKIARSLGVRTSGGGYSIETTKPRRLNSGGYVYTMNDGDIVPGPNINADVVPAMLTPGEFVVRRDAVTPETLPILQSINGRGTDGPYQNLGSNGPIQAFMKMARGGARPMLSKSLIGRLFPGRLTSRAEADFYEPKGNAGLFGGNVSGRKLSATTAKINKAMEGEGVDPRLLLASVNARGGGSRLSTDVFLDGLMNSGIITKSEKRDLSRNIFTEYAKKILSMGSVTDKNNPVWSVSDQVLKEKMSGNPSVMAAWSQFSRSPGSFAHPTRRSSTSFLNKMNVNGQTINFANLEASGSNKFYHAKEPSNPFIQLLDMMIGGRNPNAAKFPSTYQTQAHGSSFLGMPLVRRGNSFGRTMDTINTLSANRPNTMPRGTYTAGAYQGYNRKNSGGMIRGYNRGGMVGGMPVRGYNKGGQITSQLGMMAGSIGGSMIGSSVAGPIGGLVGSIAGGFLPQLLGMLRSREISAAAQIFSKTNIAIGGTVAALGFLYNAYQKHNEQLRLSTLGYGLSEEAASKAGLKYKDLGLTLKEAIKNNQAMAEKNRLVYASLTQSGTPLKLTIEQYRKLKEEVKSTMPDIIKLIDQTKTKDVGDLAVRLKTMFMQAGMAADEATKKTYALIEASNKSGMGARSISSQDFRSVSNLETAAAFGARAFNRAELSGNSKLSYQALQSAVNGISLGIDEIVSKSKTNISYQDAVAQQFQKINNLSGKQLNISSATIDQVKKQMPELGKVLNETDNIKTVWEKYQLVIQGTTEDLKGMTTTAVDALYKMNLAIETGTKKSIENGQLASSINLVKELTERQNKLKTQAKGASVEQQINSKKQIEGLQKQIELIKSEAAARKKALQEKQSDENALIAIQKKQLEYQDALASGDMSRAAQAQLDIQQISKEQQTVLAERAIDKRAEQKIAPLQKQLDALNKANEDLANNATKASSALEDLASRISNIVNATKAYEDLAVQIKQNLASPTTGDAYRKGEQYKADLATLSQLFTEAQKLNPDLKTPKGVEISKGTPTYTTGSGVTTVGATSASDIGKQLIDQIKFSKIETDSVTILANNIKTESKGGAVGGGTTFGPGIKEVTSSTLRQAVKDAFGGKIGTRKFSPQGTDDVYNIFEWQGKKYAVDQFTGTNLYNFDMQRNKLGDRIPKFHNGTGPGGVPAPYGKEMLAIVEGGERIFPKEYNAGLNGSSYQGNSYTIQNNINGSDMNTQELADMVTRRTLAAIKTIEYNQIRTSGQRRSF
jgi:TP901 family phage tail tape measure protein